MEISHKKMKNQKLLHDTNNNILVSYIAESFNSLVNQLITLKVKAEQFVFHHKNLNVILRSKLKNKSASSDKYLFLLYKPQLSCRKVARYFARITQSLILWIFTILRFQEQQIQRDQILLSRNIRKTLTRAL